VVLAQRLGRLADLALAGQEDQHIARSGAMRLVHRIDDGIVEVARPSSLPRRLGQRPKRVSIGYSRPETSITGAPSKCLLKRSASSVAEVTITFRSRRLGSNCLR
jgi:hypothetical protein